MIDDKQTRYPRANNAYHKAKRDNEERVDALLAECEKMEDELRDRNYLIKTISHTVNYWEEVSEHDCECRFPIGGCLKCDMRRIREGIEKLTQ
jgi:hypothetical protein